MSSFDELVEIMAKLRGPEGCPWDREQTHAALRRYLIEEAHEVVETIDAGDDAALKEELGDLLLQIVFHAEIARGEGRFDMDDVVLSLNAKLKRRHPHVFGQTEVKSAQDVIEHWERIKRGEKGEQVSRLAGIPRSLPALLYAYKLQKRMANAGFDWAADSDIEHAFLGELHEFEEAWHGRGDLVEETGDLLFMVVNMARRRGLEPETVLKRAIKKFDKRFRYMEDKADELGVRLEDMSLEEQDRLWEDAKAREVRDG